MCRDRKYARGFQELLKGGELIKKNFLIDIGFSFGVIGVGVILELYKLVWNDDCYKCTTKFFA